MNTTRTFIGGIAGGVVYFLLGYLIYGMLLANYMRSFVSGVDRSGDVVFWALILGNLFLGFVISYVVNRSGNASVTGGLVTGFVVGFLFSAGFDFTMYATTHLISLHQVAADVMAFTVISASAGFVIGAVSRPRAIATT